MRKKKPEKILVSVRLPREHMDLLRSMAEKDESLKDESMVSVLIRRAIRDFLEREGMLEKPHEPKPMHPAIPEAVLGPSLELLRKHKTDNSAGKFSVVLRSNRAFLGLTQKEFASKCGLHASQISRFETGKGKPSLKNLTKIANALGCSLDELTNRVEEKEFMGKQEAVDERVIES